MRVVATVKRFLSFSFIKGRRLRWFGG